MDTSKPVSSPSQSETVFRHTVFQTSNANSCDTIAPLRWSSILLRHAIWVPYKVHIKRCKPNTFACCIILYASLQFQKFFEVQSGWENHVWEGGETASKVTPLPRDRRRLPSTSPVPLNGKLPHLKTKLHKGYKEKGPADVIQAEVSTPGYVGITGELDGGDLRDKKSDERTGAGCFLLPLGHTHRLLEQLGR